MLTVEDGTGLANADSLVSLEEAKQYFADRVVYDWQDYSDEEKEAALRVASYFLFRFPFRGYQTNPEQALAFPRAGLVDSEGLHYYDYEIPTRIKHAVIELALRSAKGQLQQDVEPNQRIQSKSESVGPISESVTYFDDGETAPTVQVVDMLVKPFIYSTSDRRLISQPMRVVF